MPLQWEDGGPRNIVTWLEEIIAELPDAIHEVAVDEASRGESEMKERAPWKDRSTNARQGLAGTAEQTEEGSIIYLYHVVDYGPSLELGTKRSRPYPILKPIANEIRVTYAEGAIEVINGLLA